MEYIKSFFDKKEHKGKSTSSSSSSGGSWTSWDYYSILTFLVTVIVIGLLTTNVGFYFANYPYVGIRPPVAFGSTLELAEYAIKGKALGSNPIASLGASALGLKL